MQLLTTACYHLFSFIWFFIYFVVDAVKVSPQNASDKFVSKEKQLIKFLLDRYDQYGRVGRPVTNTTDSINVEFGLSLIQILNVDERNQVLETNVWCKYVSIYYVYIIRKKTT